MDHLETHQANCEEVLGREDFVDEQKAYAAEVEQFIKTYPGYCKSCSGWGGNTSCYDPSPAGISLSPGYMMDWEPCSNCVEEGRCPRCGGTCEFEEGPDHYVCRGTCGWSSDDDEPGIPDGPEPPCCTCEPDYDVNECF